MSEPSGLYLTKAEYAYVRVHERILSGDLPPGSVMHQASLAREIGISTTPLREALRRLMAQGLVELDAHRDARVTLLRAEEARDLLEIRRSLDPLAAALAAERRTSSDIDDLRGAARLLVPLPADPNMEQFVAHRTFHAAVYCSSHNDLLIQTLSGLWDKADRYRRLALDLDRGEHADRAQGEHVELLECVIAGDTVGASAVMRRHVDSSLGAKAARWLLASSRDSGQNAGAG